LRGSGTRGGKGEPHRIFLAIGFAGLVSHEISIRFA
jgi:hypothetical protein